MLKTKAQNYNSVTGACGMGTAEVSTATTKKKNTVVRHDTYANICLFCLVLNY